LSAAVNDIPVTQPTANRGLWRLPAAPPYLPRIVTVAYRHQLAFHRGSVSLEAVRVVANDRVVPAARTLWQIETVPSLKLAAADGSAISRRSFDARRQREVEAAATAASPLAFQLPPWELQAWFLPWLRRLPADVDKERPWSNLRKESAAWLNANAVASSAPSTSPKLLPTTSWHELPPGENLALVRTTRWEAVSRWLLALATIAAAAAAMRYRQQLAPLAQVFRRWPAVAGVLVGAFWWLALSPAAVGMAIVAASVAALIRGSIPPTTAEPPEAPAAVATGTS
jgi:hypothetical protein